MTASEGQTPPDAAAWAARSADLAGWATTWLVNRDDRCGKYYSRDGRTRLCADPPKEENARPGFLSRGRLVRHFRATRTKDVVGIYSYGPDKVGKWVALDIDNHDDNDDPATNEAFALAAYDATRRLGFHPLLYESNGRGGFHLWVVFASPVPVVTLRRLGRWLARGHASAGLTTEPEVFPKNEGETPWGSWLRLPGRHHTRPVWPRIWTGCAWVRGEAAVAHVLSVAGGDPEMIPDEAAHFGVSAATGEPEATITRPCGAVEPGWVEPWQDYDRRAAAADVAAILERHGWGRGLIRPDGAVGYVRPGKESTAGEGGNLKVVDGVAVFYCHTTHGGMRTGPNRPSAVLAHLTFGGDFAASNRALFVAGYGSRVNPKYGRGGPAGVPPTTSAIMPRPFPVGALPEPVRGFVAAGAEAIGCDPSYLALPLLVAMAAAAGNTRRLELKRGWHAPPILWGAVVGESGTAKTPAFMLVLRPARVRQGTALKRSAEKMRRHEADLARWEKDYAAWKRSKGVSEEPPPKPAPPHVERFVVSDTTVEALAPVLMANPRGVLLARDELSGWVGSFDRYVGQGKGGADSANWLSMFNAESVVVDRKTGAYTIYVPHAAVSVVGGIPPDILRRALGTEHRESGLAARLLLTWPPRKAKRWTEADIDPEAEAELARLFDRLYDLQPAVGEDGEPRPVVVRMTPEAKALFTAYYDAHAKEQMDLTGDLSAAWSKLEEYAARLALVVHLARVAAGRDRNQSTTLDADSMAAGITLAMWFKGEARRVYAMLSESDAEGDERRLVEWVERKGGSVTPRQVQQGCRWLKASWAAEEALEALVKAGRGAWRDAPTTAKGGRPARVFVLSTPSTAYQIPTTDVARRGSVDVDNIDTDMHRPDDPSAFPFGSIPPTVSG